MSINYPTLAHFRHISSLLTDFPSTTVENSLQITPFYAKQTQFCAFLARKRRFHGKTKPIQTQFKPKQSQFQASKRKDCHFSKGNYADQMLRFCIFFVIFQSATSLRSSLRQPSIRHASQDTAHCTPSYDGPLRPVCLRLCPDYQK